MNDLNNSAKAGAQQPPPGGAAKAVFWLPSLAAAMILVFFAFILRDMFQYATGETTTEHWQRLLFLYNGLESLAFAAAGVLLGERVQRARALAAESRADNAEVRAEDAQQNAAEAIANGKALKTAVESKVRASGALESTSTAPELAELSDLAGRLFPD